MVVSSEVVCSTYEWRGRTGPLTLVLRPGVFTPTHTTVVMADALEIKPEDVVIDVGCGSGVLGFVAARLGAARIIGCDVSAAMLRHANASWRDRHSRPEFAVITKDRAPFGDGTFDIIVVCCVLHHIPIGARSRVFEELRRLLAAGGRCVVFEHNPYNPATRWMVSRSPIDRNVTLLNAKEVSDSLEGAGLCLVKRTYMIFVPPRLPGASAIDARLGWLPLGGQFAVVGEKPATA